MCPIYGTYKCYMKTFRLIFVVLYLTSLSAHIKAQDYNIDSVLLKKFNSAGLLADMEFVREKILTKKYNRTPYLFLTEDKFKSCYDSITSVITNQGSMTLKDFYFLVSPFVNSVNDDHLGFRLFGLWGIENNKPKIFSQNIMWGASAIILDKNIYMTCSNELPEKSLIIYVNGIPASQIIAQLLKYSTHPQQRYYEKCKVLTIRFYDYSLIMYSIWNFKDSITVEYQLKGAKTIEVKTVYLNKFFDNKAVQACAKKGITGPVDLTFEKNTAILRLNTFSLPTPKTIELYNQIFDSIKVSKSNKLILDISENGGGSDLNWIIFLRYITNTQFQINCNAPRFTALNLLNEFKIDHSKIDTTSFYNGKIYLITGSKTFSSAVRFADVMKTNELCEKVFGQETLGQATHYGEMKTYFLPNTKLQFDASSKLFLSVSCNTDRNGVIPNVLINESTIDGYLSNTHNENTIRKVLEIIK